MLLLNLLISIVSHPLTRDQKLAAIIRFFKWQFGSRLVPGETIFNWIGPSKFIVRTGETGLTRNVYCGLDEFPDMSFLLHFLREDDLFVDVGANVGSYTILACAAVGARGVAIEPIPATYKRLVDNIHINRIGHRVLSINKGAGAESGRVSFTSDYNQKNHVLAEGERCESRTSVDVATLDEILGGERPALIKIDVEGFEASVLTGASKTLRDDSLKAVVIELNGSGDRYGFDESRIVELMNGLGFGTYSYNPFRRLLTGLSGKNTNSGNTLFIRDKAFVDGRLSSAQKISIMGKVF